jgi:SAM-dependent methyltransferase
MASHFNQLAARLIERFDLLPRSLVFEIGCNDGTLLDAFARRGQRVLGIDPGVEPGRIAREKGILVFPTYWNEKAGGALRSLALFPDLIVASAVLYHVPDLHAFVAGLRQVMREDTVFVAQCVSLQEVLQQNSFDHFYHEHSCLHAVTPLRRLFHEHGLRLFEVESVAVHGGSFLAYFCLDSASRATAGSVARFLEAEQAAGLNRFETYRAFAERVTRNAENLRRILRQLASEGKRVCGLGAPAKGSTLLNFCRIEPGWVSALVEVNPLKIGRYSPGIHIPIVGESEVRPAPDYYLVLSWTMLDYFKKKYAAFLRAGGRFIVPVPEVTVLGAEALGDPSAVKA